MQSEFNALLANNTWSLVHPSIATNVVGCKWVFKLKHKADGMIECHKAHLVAKGFHQQAGIRGGQNPPDPINPLRPAPSRPDPSGFCAFFRGYGLKFPKSARIGLGLGLIKKNMRIPDPPRFYPLFHLP
jgi:hypothetical protein